MARSKQSSQVSLSKLQDLKTDYINNLPEGSKPGIIYPLYRDIVRRATAYYPAHTRLPPVRDIASAMEISLTTAQRVINELVSEGTLYSRPRSGTFTAEQISQEEDTEQSNDTTNSFFESSFCFGTESAESYQRKFWQHIVDRFKSRHPNLNTRIKFAPSPEELKSNIDVYEHLNWNDTNSIHQTDSLDLRGYLPEDIATRCTPEGKLPLYFRSNFLFYNCSLLRKHGIPEPHYKTFTEQIEYLSHTAKSLEKAGFNPKPFSVQQPITLLGADTLEKFFSIAKNDSSENDLRDTVTSIQQALHFCLLCRRNVTLDNTPKDNERGRFFETKEIPFFLGHSVDYWKFCGENPDTSIKCYPILNTNDQLFLWPMVGSVSSKSKHPVESIHFLSHLLNKDTQFALSQTGQYPSSLHSSCLPKTTAETSWHQERFTQSQPMRLSSPERCYLAVNILNNQLWQVLLGQSSVEKAVKDALHWGRAYIKQTHSSSFKIESPV